MEIKSIITERKINCERRSHRKSVYERTTDAPVPRRVTTRRRHRGTQPSVGSSAVRIGRHRQSGPTSANNKSRTSRDGRRTDKWFSHELSPTTKQSLSSRTHVHVREHSEFNFSSRIYFPLRTSMEARHLMDTPKHAILFWSLKTFSVSQIKNDSDRQEDVELGRLKSSVPSKGEEEPKDRPRKHLNQQMPQRKITKKLRKNYYFNFFFVTSLIITTTNFGVELISDITLSLTGLWKVFEVLEKFSDITLRF